MNAGPTPSPPSPHPHKRRRGLHRLWHALGYSLAGLRTAWRQPAFRQEALISLALIPWPAG